MERFFNDEQLDLSSEAIKELTVHELHDLQELYDVFNSAEESEVRK